jgi:hypothetical protein
MESANHELALWQSRLERLEREVQELKERQLHSPRLGEVNPRTIQIGRPDSLVLHVEQVPEVQKMKVSDAKRAIHHALRDLLVGLLAVRQHANEPGMKHLLLVASADGQTARAELPITIPELIPEHNMEALATLCAACGNPTRVKLLQVLYLREECTKAELVQASGTSGGNLYQQLGELHRVHLLTQPQRGHYRLTTHGRSIIEVLFWCADRLTRSPLQETDQVGWFDQEELD